MGWKGEKSHKSITHNIKHNTDHIFVGKLPVNRFNQICTLVGDMLDVIHCANFGMQKLGVLGYMGVKVRALRLKRLVTLTAVLHYRTACEY